MATPLISEVIAGIAEGLAGGIDCLKDDKVVLVPAASLVAASIAIWIFAVTVRGPS